MRKALAMGATSGSLVTDDALGGSDTVSTARVLAAALRGPRVRPRPRRRRHLRRRRRRRAGRVATLLGLPYLSYAAKIEPDPAARTRPRPPDQPDRLRRPRGADAGPRSSATQALGEPRYPSLKGIMAARSKDDRDAVAWPTSALDAATVGGARRDDDASLGSEAAAAARPRPG